MLDTQDIWAGRDLYSATPAATWGLGFCGLILSNHSVTLFNKQVVTTYSNLDLQGTISSEKSYFRKDTVKIKVVSGEGLSYKYRVKDP